MYTNWNDKTERQVKADMRSVERTARSIQKKMDSLWVKAKETGCPKEFTDWLMWVEHEVSRSTWYLGHIAKDYK